MSVVMSNTKHRARRVPSRSSPAKPDNLRSCFFMRDGEHGQNAARRTSRRGGREQGSDNSGSTRRRSESSKDCSSFKAFSRATPKALANSAAQRRSRQRMSAAQRRSRQRMSATQRPSGQRMSAAQTPKALANSAQQRPSRQRMSAAQRRSRAANVGPATPKALAHVSPGLETTLGQTAQEKSTL